ncbi:MAG: glycine C-acetyltransferase [Anaerolineaceae bacterium]|nr:glycine C-acetyltransferase [Anaerolineaceae bacterium]
MKDNLEWLNKEINNLKESGLYTNISTISSPQGSWLEINGKRALNFCSNNYLGLANHPKLVRAAKAAIDKYGVGSGAVRLISGTNDLHLELEKRILKFKSAESAITFQTGFAANLGTISALIGKDDIIFSDQLNHASIIDGCRLTKAPIIRFKHADPVDLKRAINEHQGKYRHALAVTDGVFSMDGDIAPLDKLYEITRENNIMLMVDDAHGEGVLGRGGRGIVDHFNLQGKIDIEVGTFSKAFGVIGGVVTGKTEIVEWLRQRARPFVFSTATTPADTAACIAAIDILEESTELVDRLWENTNYFKKGINTIGFDTGNTETPIIPVMIGEAHMAQKFSRELFTEGVYALQIGYPIVPKGKARIRAMISASHTKDDLDYSLDAFTKVGHRLGLV